MANVINWFEIPVTDFERARQFYSAIMDYELQQIEMNGEQLGFFDTQQDGVGGCIAKGEPHTPSEKGTLIYLNGGDDLNVILNRVPSAGGSIAQPKTKVTDEIGFVAYFIDTEGNRIGIHSPQ